MNALCIHGWAFGPAIWNDLIRALMQKKPEIECSSLDLGFFGTPVIQQGHFDVVITHSFGLPWFLFQQEITCQKIVSISGFTRFFQSTEFPHGVPQKIIARMRKKLEKDPLGLLKDFHSKCGFDPTLLDRNASDHPIMMEEFDPERLDWGLCGLNTFDLREQWTNLNVAREDRLVIASTEDPIVSQELTTACFNEAQINWIDSSSHLLPIAESKQCGRLILNFLKKQV